MTINNAVLTTILIMFSFITAPIVCADNSVSLVLSEDDIQGVVFEENSAWIKLSASATIVLTELTNDANQGKWLEISVEDLHAIRARINATIDSGIIKLDRPSSSLSRRLREIEMLRRKK